MRSVCTRSFVALVAVLGGISMDVQPAHAAPIPLPLEIFTDPAGQVDGPREITVGPDGNLWFTSTGSDRIGRITLDGEITTFADPDGQVDSPGGITAGPDDNLWFTSTANDRIGRISTAGSITTFADPAGLVDQPEGITSGPDGNLWFTSPGNRRVGRINPTGEIETFAGAGTVDHLNYPLAITTGPDGNLWVADAGSHRLVRVTPLGEIFSFPVPSTGPLSVVAGPDGSLWFTYGSAFSTRVGRMSISGEVEFFIDPSNGTPNTFDIAAGADGNLWFTDAYMGRVGRVTPDGEITMFTDSLGEFQPLEGQGRLNRPAGITSGPDGHVWFVLEGSDAIGRLDLGAPLSGTVTAEGAQTAMLRDGWVVAVATDGSGMETARTNADGEYTMFVDPGTYVVEFVDPSAALMGEWHDNRPLWALNQARPVAVPADGVAVDAALSPNPETASIAGTVTSAGSGAGLSARWVAAVRLGAESARLAGGTTTGDGGAYRISGLEPGPYLVMFADPLGTHDPEFFDDTTTAPDLVDTTAGATTTVNAGLAPRASAPTPNATIRGTVTGGGAPVSGAWVAAVNANTGVFARGTRTNAQGAYTLNVPTASYRVEFIDPTGSHDGEWFDDQPLTGFSTASLVNATSSVPVNADADLSQGSTGTIAGTVTGATGGAPIAGTWVGIVADTGRFVGGTRAGLDGRYRMTKLDPGHYIVVFVDPSGHHRYEYRHDAASPGAATLTAVVAGATTTLDESLSPIGTTTARGPRFAIGP